MKLTIIISLPNQLSITNTTIPTLPQRIICRLALSPLPNTLPTQIATRNPPNIHHIRNTLFLLRESIMVAVHLRNIRALRRHERGVGRQLAIHGSRAILDEVSVDIEEAGVVGG